ncbi:hypothetical protein CBR_g38097 [Chara braunii]|uniref:Transmembrane protein n=1 Tax=Chara braunii TaxID=69332 RepID=A0A388K0A2_CHABU|nr:hypothetical protein CBR_g38097 [Chara braunii]|eukprot:GBG63479.1 hypothetical protein CBR_g38097 [Chara braunii]
MTCVRTAAFPRLGDGIRAICDPDKKRSRNKQLPSLCRNMTGGQGVRSFTAVDTIYCEQRWPPKSQRPAEVATCGYPVSSCRHGHGQTYLADFPGARRRMTLCCASAAGDGDGLVDEQQEQEQQQQKEQALSVEVPEQDWSSLGGGGEGAGGDDSDRQKRARETLEALDRQLSALASSDTEQVPVASRGRQRTTAQKESSDASSDDMSTTLQQWDVVFSPGFLFFVAGALFAFTIAYNIFYYGLIDRKPPSSSSSSTTTAASATGVNARKAASSSTSFGNRDQDASSVSPNAPPVR